MKKQMLLIYINGLGEGVSAFKKYFLKRSWGRVGVDIIFFEVDWYKSVFENIKYDLEKLLADSLLEYDTVIILGVSAGASLGFHAFAEQPKNVFLINANGRIKDTKYPVKNPYSPKSVALLKSHPRAPAFYHCLLELYRPTHQLKEMQKRRILTLKPLVDRKVPPHLMSIDKVTEIRTFALGHGPACVYHALFCKRKILRFVKEQCNTSPFSSKQ